jgi:thioesterase domain-containing protein
VIQGNTMRYEKPIPGDFTARAAAPAVEDWNAFERMLLRKGRARITVTSTLACAGQEVGRLEGEFVALAMAG